MVSPGAPPGVVPTGGGLQWVADSEAPIIRHQHTPGAAHRGPSAWPRRGSRPRLRFTGKPVTVQGQVIRFYFTGDSPPASLLPGQFFGGRRGPSSRVAGIVPSRYTSLTGLRFTVQWIYASLVAHLYLLYGDTRVRCSTLLYYYSTTIMLVLYLPAVSSSFFLLHIFSDRGAWELRLQLTA